MSSLRRILASRANGARSRGPSTPQGKERSAQNALQHGLAARCIVLKGESRDAFQSALDRYIERFRPIDDVEMALVEEMAASFWRQRRAWAIETRMLDGAIDAATEGDPLDRIALAFCELAATPQLALMHRYETRLHMTYQRALNNLLAIQRARMQNEPNPDSEQADEPPAPGDSGPDPAAPPPFAPSLEEVATAKDNTQSAISPTDVLKYDPFPDTGKSLNTPPHFPTRT